MQPAMESDPAVPVAVWIWVRALENVGQLAHILNKQVPFEQVVLGV
ncbi:MAG: hypothetical protein JSV33_02035 [bacterium]|nr:MAG: hypothetical protein JSV33_02035 [bacterium]